MVKTRAKLLLWILLLMLAAGIGWYGIGGLARLLAYFQQGADPAAALNIVPNVPPNLRVSVTWAPDAADTGRVLEPFAREQIESAYKRAWLQWNLSYLRGEPYGLATYFSGPALNAVTEAVTRTVSQQIRIAQVDTTHHLQLHFYSADGSIVSFTDSGANVAQMLFDATNTAIAADESRSTYDVVMMLDDGNWRVRYLQRTAVTVLADAGIEAPQNISGVVGVIGRSLVVDGQPFTIAGINYYPQATPWELFWTTYDADVIERDFERIQALGLNTIRIFVQYSVFGGPDVDPEMVARLDDLLERAETHQLKVIVTLFDFRTDYNLLLWPESDRHLETLLTHFATDPAILAWDLKNEPDRDFGPAERLAVLSWLEHTASLARRYDPYHLLTIGWSDAANASALSTTVDFVSYHFYQPAAMLSAQIDALQQAVPDRPLVLTEFGLPTWNSFVFPGGHSQPEQAEYYADVLGVLRMRDGAGYVAWTLYDFDHIPGNVSAGKPWRAATERRLGILQADGQAKPAAALLRPNADLHVTRVPAWARFLKPFWLTLYTCIALVVWLVRRYGRQVSHAMVRRLRRTWLRRR